MKHRPPPLWLVLFATIALVGCSGVHRVAPDWSSGGAPPPPASPRDETPALTSDDRSVPSATGCLIATTRFQPRHPQTQVPVILAPGFLRDRRQLHGLAAALAARGIPVVTLNFCPRRPWIGQPVRNALDMLAVARWLGDKPVVYAGFSAGGLAALVAGRLDPHTLGVLTLDLVDSQGLGVGMARALRQPLLGLAGAPTACNAHNNGLPVFAVAPQARLTRIPAASHCDFESPTDWLCTRLCTGVDAGSPARRQAIIDAAVTGVADLVGLTPRSLTPTAGPPHHPR